MEVTKIPKGVLIPNESFWESVMGDSLIPSDESNETMRKAVEDFVKKEKPFLHEFIKDKETTC